MTDSINANGATVKTNHGLPGFSADLRVVTNDYAMGVTELSAYLTGLTPTDAVTFPQSNLMKFEPTSTDKIAVFSFDNADAFETACQLQFLTGHLGHDDHRLWPSRRGRAPPEPADLLRRGLGGG